MWSRLLAVLLVLAMWPGLSELVELAQHAVEHGDIAHDQSDEHDSAPLGEDEHGCSGTFHLCPCHSPTPAMASADTVRVPAGETIEACAQLTPSYQVGLGLAAPPTRPPIA